MGLRFESRQSDAKIFGALYALGSFAIFCRSGDRRYFITGLVDPDRIGSGRKIFWSAIGAIYESGEEARVRRAMTSK